MSSITPLKVRPLYHDVRMPVWQPDSMRFHVFAYLPKGPIQIPKSSLTEICTGLEIVESPNGWWVYHHDGSDNRPLTAGELTLRYVNANTMSPITIRHHQALGYVQFLPADIFAFTTDFIKQLPMNTKEAPLSDCVHPIVATNICICSLEEYEALDRK